MRGAKPEQENVQAYISSWIAYGLFGWIDEWMTRGMQESPKEMAKLVDEVEHHFKKNNI